MDLNLGRIFISGAILVSLPVSIIWFYWNQFNHQKRFSLYKDLLFFVLSLILGTLLYVVIITYLVYQRWIIPYPDLTIHQSYLSGLAKVAKPESSHFNLASRLLPSGTIYSEIIYTFIFVFLLWGIFIGLLNYWGRKLAEQKSSLFGIILVGPFLMLLMFAQTRIRTHAWGSEASIWKATIRENPLSFLGWNNLGRAYIQRGKLKEALPCFVMAHSLKPDLLEPILNLGNTLLKAGELDFAQHYYEWALKINPYSFIARLNLANCLATKQEYHQAVENYLEVLKLKPDSFEATYNLALCFLGLGDRARAQFYLLKTLRLAPEHQPSQILLEQLRKVPP